MSEDEKAALYVTLKEYFDTRILALDRATAQAASQMERRLEGMNEFRDTLKDQAARLITREEFTAVMGSMNKEIAGLREFRSALEAKASQASVMYVAVLSFLSLMVGVIGLLVKFIK